MWETEEFRPLINRDITEYGRGLHAHRPKLKQARQIPHRYPRLVVLPGLAGLVPELLTDLPAVKQSGIRDSVNLKPRQQRKTQQTGKQFGAIFDCAVEAVHGSSPGQKSFLELLGCLPAKIAFTEAEVDLAALPLGDFFEQCAYFGAFVQSHCFSSWYPSSCGE